MILVSEVWEETKKIFGHCKEDKLFRWLTDAVEVLAQKGEIDPLVGEIDLCTSGDCVTLPNIIETVLAVNLCGHPAHAQDQVFQYHQNGPGSHGCGCSWSWADRGNSPLYRDLRCPAKLVAFLDSPEDSGKLLRVFGWDSENRPLRTKVGEVWENGLRVPTVFGYSLPASTDPLVSRIDGIVKDRTVANVRLSSFDSSTSTGTLLGVYEPNEVKPLYRRIKICPCAPWVRILFRRRSFELHSLDDRIFLHSRPALICMLRSLKFMDDGDLANSQAYEANATRLITEREWCLGSPAGMPIQVVDMGNSVSNKFDHLD